MDADVIVVGVGTAGSATLWRLARRGASVIGVEQYAPGHDLGSGHGESRIIRTAYFEHPSYVPLVRTAWRLWHELERLTGTDLLTRTGALMLGPPDGELVTGVLRSAKEHDLTYEVLDAAACGTRYPQHVLAPDEVAVFEPEAGFVRAEAGIRAMADAAVTAGAQLLTGEPVGSVEPAGDGVRVRVGARALTARRAVICAGAWTPNLVPGLSGALRVERQVPMWFAARDPASIAPDRFPVFVREYDGRYLYGLPSLDGATAKVGIHHEGVTTSPDTVDRTVNATDIAALREPVQRFLPGLDPVPVRGTVCLYANTPDEHFVVGSLPHAPEITIVSACSGHGFKFAPAIGEIAADLVRDGGTEHPIALFDPARFAG